MSMESDNLHIFIYMLWDYTLARIPSSGCFDLLYCSSIYNLWHLRCFVSGHHQIIIPPCLSSERFLRYI